VRDLQVCLFGDTRDIPWRAFGTLGSQKRSALPQLVAAAKEAARPDLSG
jgi:hypothetical protein